MTVESQISLNCTAVMAPVTLSYFSAIVGAIYCPLTTIGNGLVILAFLLDPFKELRTQFNFFVINLAVADLIVGAIIDPLTSWAHFQEAKRVEVRNEYPGFVKFCHYNYFASITASLLSLSALSIDRVIAVRFPLKYRSQVSYMRYGLASLLIWGLSYGLSAMYFVIGYVMMAWVMVSFSCVFTFCVMLACYYLLYVVITNREKALLASLRSGKEVKAIDNESYEGSTTAQHKKSGNTTHVNRAQNITQTRKMVAVLLVMFGFFLLCFVPATIMIFIINLEQGSCIFRHWLRDLQLCFCVTASLINPFIYTIRLVNFKRAILTILRIRSNAAVVPPASGHKMK
eukprot:Seg948.1 transcript_id=Seg948.1/GoldUCD/mRNA.D3Y31 product="alpha-1A adrenergic receptor" protein_id=Seg948.1/GoldUCD/D3Y31